MNHGGKLRFRQKNKKYTMTQIRQQSTIKRLVKPHFHDTYQRKSSIKRFGDKGNDMLLMHLNQLHKQHALLLRNKEEMSH